MRALALVAVAACRAAPSPELANVQRELPRELCVVSGRLTTVETGAPIVSAAVVLDGAPAQSEVGLTASDGRFSIMSLGTQTALTVHYANQTWKRHLSDGGCGHTFQARIATQIPRPILMWIIGPGET